MYTELLVPLDGSPLADAAIPHAVEIARRLKGGVHLLRVHSPIVPIGGPPEAAAIMLDPALDERVHEETRSWLMERAEQLRASSDVTVTAEIRVGLPVEETVAAASARRAQAIVCTTHGRGGWALRWLGSVADGLIRHASCPVIAMSEAAVQRPLALKSLLVLHDGSEVSDTIVPHASWLAHVFGADVELLRIVAPPWVGDSLSAMANAEQDPFGIDAFAEDAKHALERVAERLRREGIAAKSTVDVHMSPSRAILEHIERTNPDGVALATYGRGLSRLFLGSVADKVLRAGGRPALCFCPPRYAVPLTEGWRAASDEVVTTSNPQ